MLFLEKKLSTMIIQKLIFGIFILLGISNLANAEICSVYHNIPIFKSDSLSIPHDISFNLTLQESLAIKINIMCECNTLIFKVEGISSIGNIRIANSEGTEIYTTDVYSIYDNDILKIEFPQKISRGNYNFYFSYKSKNDKSAVFSRWFVHTNFNDNDINKENNHAIRIWVQNNVLGHGQYLLENGKKLLEAFESVTGVRYNKNMYVKLDIFVVPKNSAPKHRYAKFIYVNEETFVDEEFVATSNNEKLFRSIVETMVNQAFENFNHSMKSPFGRLVFKLREYLAYYIIDKAIPSWHLLHEYIRLQRYGIFENDFLFSHINDYEIFDNYPSNGLLIRMFEHTVGRDFFFDTLKEFIKNRTEIENTNFFNALIERSGSEKTFLKTTFKHWLRTIGYPIIKIERNYDKNSATVKQSRFLRNSNEVSLLRYWVPLNFASENDPDFNNTTVTHHFDPKLEMVEIMAPPSDQWLLCNKQQFGYYRVNYDVQNWKKIVHYLKSKDLKKIHVLNRAQLIDDAFVLAEFGYLNFNIAFDLARYLKIETEYMPLATFCEKILRLYQFSSITNSLYYEPFKNMILELLEPWEQKYLSDQEQDSNNRMERLTKIMVIRWACFYGSSICASYSSHKLKNWLENPVDNPLLDDMREAILCAGIRSTNRDTWDALMNVFLVNKDKYILHALMCSSNEESLQKLMAMFVEEQLEKQNPWYFFKKIAQQSTIGLNAIIRFIDQNRKEIYSMANSYDVIDNICVVIEQFINNDSQLEKYEKILNDNRDLIRLENVVSYKSTAINRVKHANAVLLRMKA